MTLLEALHVVEMVVSNNGVYDDFESDEDLMEFEEAWQAIEDAVRETARIRKEI